MQLTLLSPALPKRNSTVVKVFVEINYALLYQRISVKKLSMDTAIEDYSCLFRKFHPFGAFEVIQNEVRVTFNTRKDYKMYIEKYGLHNCNDKIISISEFCEVSLGICVVSDGEITQLPALDQDENERNM